MCKERTSTYLEPEQLGFLKQQATATGAGVSEILRDLVDAYRQACQDWQGDKDPLEIDDGDRAQAEEEFFPQRKRRNILPFGWYGGKYSHLDWLLPLLPKAHHFCEPFSGSGVVMLNRPPSPIETMNDVDGELINFFRVLRDQEQELIRAIVLTPFSRQELVLAVSEPADGLPPVERARRFFVRARQVRTGLAQTASEGRWATCRNTSRAGMGGAVSRWLGSVAGLAEVAVRVLRVQIESRPASEVINQYDGDKTLFYCDPPYPHEARSDTKAYGFEMSDREHIELAQLLNSVHGRAAVSGYRCDLMDALYAGWNVHNAPTKKCHSSKQPRTEALWTNY